MSRHLAAARLCWAQQESFFVRPILLAPFRSGEWNIASDAHVVFAWKGEAVPDNQEPSPVRASALALIEDPGVPVHYAFRVGDLARMLDTIPKVPEHCWGCDGKGSERCDLGHDHECRRCGGSGFNPNGKPIYFNENALVKLLELDNAFVPSGRLLQIVRVADNLGFSVISISSHLKHGYRCVFPDGTVLFFMTALTDEDERRAAHSFDPKRTPDRSWPLTREVWSKDDIRFVVRHGDVADMTENIQEYRFVCDRPHEDGNHYYRCGVIGCRCEIEEP